MTTDFTIFRALPHVLSDIEAIRDGAFHIQPIDARRRSWTTDIALKVRHRSASCGSRAFDRVPVAAHVFLFLIVHVFYVDIADHAAPLQAWALAQGFAVQRPFTRMVHGAGASAPGDAALVFCPAGPELG